MKKLMMSSLVVLLAFAAQAIAQSTSSDQTQSNQTSDQPGAGGVGNSASGDTATSPASEPSSPATQPGVSGSRTGQGASASRRNSLGAGAQSLTSQGAQGGLEQHIATCLALGNQEEVALAQFAQQRATNPQVKQFAQTMIQEHQQAIQQLQQAVPQVASVQLTSTGAAQSGRSSSRTGAGASERLGSSGREASDNNATAGADRSTASGGETASTSSTAGASQRGASASSGHEQMVEFARTVKQNCLKLNEQALGQKQGVEFDKCYIGQQIAAHTSMLAELQAAQQFTSGSQLQPLIQQGTQMTEQHLAQARTIMEQLEQASGGQGGSPARAGAPARSR
jgi:predicted outer membrane protein